MSNQTTCNSSHDAALAALIAHFTARGNGYTRCELHACEMDVDAPQSRWKFRMDFYDSNHTYIASLESPFRYDSKEAAEGAGRAAEKDVRFAAGCGLEGVN